MSDEVPDELDYDDETDSELESRVEELESRIEEVEQSQARASNSAISAGYCVGGTRNGSLVEFSSRGCTRRFAWTLLRFYVAYYVATHWAEVKFF
jgi:hypothetical protein